LEPKADQLGNLVTDGLVEPVWPVGAKNRFEAALTSGLDAERQFQGNVQGAAIPSVFSPRKPLK